ncbi:hypothetical protein CSE_05310 [Caldisericum exile AZM16c01]|uniref:Uncharacterized protein n=1 Tax=Caldisericum exile (strain DSM 21853 / NBRC 104410 / AZM16c01) TaxID=511051 RepID=A0A7U6GE08_CALEA|nr:hypothetical protein CSE_05310 [Caldisericum exile AZM16c01]
MIKPFSLSLLLYSSYASFNQIFGFLGNILYTQKYFYKIYLSNDFEEMQKSFRSYNTTHLKCANTFISY